MSTSIGSNVWTSSKVRWSPLTLSPVMKAVPGNMPWNVTSSSSVTTISSTGKFVAGSINFTEPGFVDRNRTDEKGVGQGVVAWDVQVTNQNDELVASYDILTLVMKRS